MLGLNERQFRVLEAIFDLSLQNGWLPDHEELASRSKTHRKNIGNVLRQLRQLGAITKGKHYTVTMAGILWVKRVKRERQRNGNQQ